MKTIIKILYLILIIAGLCQCKKYDPLVAIPDNNFLNALKELGIDKDGDGIISKVEAAEVTFLNVYNRNISSLKGIEAFVNMDSLDCSYNQLTSLDVSNNPLLLMLNCYDNSLTSLSVYNNYILRNLRCRNNLLTSLVVSSNPLLRELVCYNNLITGLDVSHNPELQSLWCSDNPLSSLDVSNNLALKYLQCDGNLLSSLDVSKNTALKSFYCSNNSLISLDASNNSALKILTLKSMPSLYKVCVWTMPFPPTGVTVDTTDSPNVYFTTDCSK
ncbi:MAG TPA: hypothetical protein VMV47_09535 [Bacteroidales bacterium]|nr:hypothetical protein [Bacteroidales bacterium]